MKLGRVLMLVLLAGCAPPRPYSSAPYNGATGLPRPNESRSTGSVSQDASDCERQAALSSSAGSRAEAFNNCMKARRAPN